MRGLDQVSRDVFQRRVNREKGERRVDVGKREHDGERAVEQKFERVFGQVYILEQRIEDAVAAQDRLPRIGSNQVAHP